MLIQLKTTSNFPIFMYPEGIKGTRDVCIPINPNYDCYSSAIFLNIKTERAFMVHY